MTSTAVAEGRVLVVGSGGIARRHVANLRSLMPGGQVFLLHRRPPDQLDPGLVALVDGTTRQLEEALEWQPDAAIVANAASAHVAMATALARGGSHLLVEKPLSTDRAGVDQLLEACQVAQRVLLVGYCLRFHSPLRRLREEVLAGAIGRPLSLRSEVGQFLPEWRPDTDWRNSVTAQAELGGGAILELSHEIDYAGWILGPISAVGALTATVSDLQLHVEDVADLVLRFRSGATGAIHLDLVQQPMARSCKVIGSEGTVVWDGVDDAVRSWSAPEGCWRQIVPPDTARREDMLREEMRHFLACIEGSESPEVTGAAALHVLDVCLAAKQSASESRFVSLDEYPHAPHASVAERA